MHDFLAQRLAQLIQSRERWQGLHRDLLAKTREAENVLQRLEGGIAICHEGLSQPLMGSVPDDDLILH
jgi:hypothetical protein